MSVYSEHDAISDPSKDVLLLTVQVILPHPNFRSIVQPIANAQAYYSVVIQVRRKISTVYLRRVYP